MIREIIKDKDAIWETDKYDVVLLGTSIYNMLTNGLQSKMRIKYPELETANQSTAYGDLKKLGKRVTVEGTPIISLLYICKYPNSKRVFLDYDALESCLETANSEFKGKKVMTTVLGCSRFDGNGDREKVLEIIEKATPDLYIDVYDYEQMAKRDEFMVHVRKMYKYIKSDYGRFRQLYDNRDEILKKIYLEY